MLSRFFVLALEYRAITVLLVSSGYGFVDFDNPTAAQKAVAALKTTGVQAQMAKVRIHYSLIRISRTCKSPGNTVSPPSGWGGELNLIYVVLNNRAGIRECGVYAAQPLVGSESESWIMCWNKWVFVHKCGWNFIWFYAFAQFTNRFNEA